VRVLFISSWFPYPTDNGSRIRAHNLIRALAREHEVYLIAMMQDDSHPGDSVHLDDICRVIALHESKWFKPRTYRFALGYLSALPRSYYDTYDPEVTDSVESAIEDYAPDAIVAFQMGAAVYLPREVRIPAILEELELGPIHRYLTQTRGSRRLRANLAGGKHIRLVKEVLGRCAGFTCATLEELALANSYCRPGMPGEVIPNCVDVAGYNIGPGARERADLIYNGSVTFTANADAVGYFADAIMPIILERHPEMKLKVTGRIPATEPTRRQARGDKPAADAGVVFTGYLPDIRDALRTALALVVPLRTGGGSRLKILEAMAAGVPVVSTTIGAEGIHAVHGEHILIADTPGEFAEAVDTLARDRDFADHLRLAARGLVERRYDWKGAGGSFVEMVERIAAAGVRTGAFLE